MGYQGLIKKNPSRGERAGCANGTKQIVDFSAVRSRQCFMILLHFCCRIISLGEAGGCPAGSRLSQLTVLATEVSQILSGGAFGKHSWDCRCRTFLVFGNFYHHLALFPIIGCRRSSKQHLEQVPLAEPQQVKNPGVLPLTAWITPGRTGGCHLQLGEDLASCSLKKKKNQIPISLFRLQVTLPLI